MNAEPRQGPRRRPAGFTLVELLVAVLVFGLLAAAGYAAVRSLLDAAETHERRAASFAALQRSVTALDADLRQLVSRSGPTPGGQAQPALAGTPVSLTGRRAGRASPAGLERSRLQRFGWFIESGTLVRLAWPAEGDGTPVRQPFLDDVLGFELRYRDALGRWTDAWPAEGGGFALPVAVRYRLEHARFGTIDRLVAL